MLLLREPPTTELSDKDSSSRARRAFCAPGASAERGLSLSFLDQYSTTYTLPQICHTLCIPLFSCTYELPNLQVLCIVATVPGDGGVPPIAILNSYFNWVSEQGHELSSRVYPAYSCLALPHPIYSHIGCRRSFSVFRPNGNASLQRKSPLAAGQLDRGGSRRPPIPPGPSGLGRRPFPARTHSLPRD